jgi:hypothetical protein
MYLYKSKTIYFNKIHIILSSKKNIYNIKQKYDNYNSIARYIRNIRQRIMLKTIVQFAK